MRTSITLFASCSISKKGTSKPFLSLTTSPTGAVSDAITTHPALNASSRDHERYFNAKGYKLHELSSYFMLGGAFSHLN